jgi:histidyl-tRNA synthetase
MAAATVQPILGMSDLCAPEVYIWQMMEQRARALMKLYGFEEVRTPIMERPELFVRSLGDTTDVVQKEMYAFERGRHAYALRPEGTAGMMRFAAAQGQNARDARWYYMGPMFRAERPQRGRKRQFHQFGLEMMSPANPALDVECIALQHHLLTEWGLSDYTIHINTRGTPHDREAVARQLRERLDPLRAELCEDCQRRFEHNVLRILDCKQEQCGRIVDELPPVSAFMSEDARGYLARVMQLLEKLEIPVQLNPRLVRGLDYYLHTVWEITHPALGAQDAVAGGGRYCIELDGKALEGVGFAAGLERIVDAVQGEGLQAESLRVPPSVWIVSLGEGAFETSMELLMLLRRRGIACGMDMNGRSMKAQMRLAGKSGVDTVIIRGEAEMEQGIYIVKNMGTGEQQELDLPGLLQRLSRVHELQRVGHENAE